MRKLLIAFSLALLLFSCNDDDVNNDNNNDNGIKEDPTFTVTYQLDAPGVIYPPNVPITHEPIGSFPVDNNKYKSGDTVTVLSTDIKLKEIATGKITHEFDCWFTFDFKDKSFWLPGDEFVIENNVIFSITSKPYFED